MNILNPAFKYVPAAKTDIRKTIAKEKARLKAKAETDAANLVEAQCKVATLKRRAEK